MCAFPQSGEAGTRPPVVALTGFMAAGKSTVGRALASLLHWRFLDLDCEIESSSKQQIHEIFAAYGEPRFRQIEADTLRTVLEQAAGPIVIALGGGTFVQPQNADLLQQHGVHVVFLELAIEDLLERCRAAAERAEPNPRPLAADSEAFCALYVERLPFYRKAELVVHTRAKTAEQVAQEIVQALRLADHFPR